MADYSTLDNLTGRAIAWRRKTRTGQPFDAATVRTPERTIRALGRGVTR